MQPIKIVLVVGLLVLVAGIFYWSTKNDSSSAINSDTYQSGATVGAVKEIKKYAYTESYTHPTKNFSFNYPKSFTAKLLSNDGVETILVQNTTTKVGAQIVISTFDGPDIDITADVLKSEIPDMKIDNPQALAVAGERKGLAFGSDNPAFGGKSSEIWFVHQSHLYQMSTYYEFEDFLRKIFETFNLK